MYPLIEMRPAAEIIASLWVPRNETSRLEEGQFVLRIDRGALDFCLNAVPTRKPRSRHDATDVALVASANQATLST